jgi:hypothetical protein
MTSILFLQKKNVVPIQCTVISPFKSVLFFKDIKLMIFLVPELFNYYILKTEH